MNRFDLHVHTHYSYDCSARPEDIIKEAKRKGLRGIAVTDHYTSKGYDAVKELAGDDLIVIKGKEVDTRQGHTLFLYNKGETFKILAHPISIYTTFLAPFQWRKFDGVETYNSRNPLFLNKITEILAKKYGCIMTGGSDTHHPELVGECCTLINADSVDGVFRELRAGRTIVEHNGSSMHKHMQYDIINKEE